MEKEEIQKLIKELVEKTTVKLNNVSSVDDGTKNMWFSVEVNEPHFFISRDGEGLHALNYLLHRIIENKLSPMSDMGGNVKGLGIIVDINGFKQKQVDGIRAIAHMMSERARYFKSNIEVDPMSSFERRIIHEFLSNATDLKTESIGMGRDRRVVIKYVGSL